MYFILIFTIFSKQQIIVEFNSKKFSFNLLIDSLNNLYSEKVFISKLSGEYFKLFLKLIIKFNLLLKEYINTTEWKSLDGLFNYVNEISKIRNFIENDFIHKIIKEINDEDLVHSIKGNSKYYLITIFRNHKIN